MRLISRHRHFAVAYVLLAAGLLVAPSVTIEGDPVRADVRQAVTAQRLELAYNSTPPAAADMVSPVPRRRSADALIAQRNESTPVRIAVPRIGIDGPVAPVGIGTARQLDVPLALTAGWYRHSSIPDMAGATVLAAHVDFGGQPGLFFNLRLAGVGDRITLELADGDLVEYEITAVTLYDKTELPSEELFRSAGDHALHLVTCGGTFDRFARSYRGNQVVTAVPTEV